MKQEERLKAVRRTLEEIDVRGRNNIDKMLGCMMALDQIIVEASRLTQEAGKDESNISDNG